MCGKNWLHLKGAVKGYQLGSERRWSSCFKSLVIWEIINFNGINSYFYNVTAKPWKHEKGKWGKKEV